MALIAALFATTASTVVAHRLGSRWRRGGPHPSRLAWSVGVAMLAIASLALLVGALAGFTEPLFRLHVLFGAVLDVPWLALGWVLVGSRDRTTTRLTGLATVAVGLAFLPGAWQGESLAIPGAVLGIAWGLVQLDGDRTRVRIGSSVLVVGWSLLAVSLVLPAPLAAELPAAGLPDAAVVLPAFVGGFARAGSLVGTTVVVVGALVAVARLLWAHADLIDGDPAPAAPSEASVQPVQPTQSGLLAGWRALGPAGLRDRAVGSLLVAAGAAVVAGSGALGLVVDDATTARAIGIGVGVVVMAPGFARLAPASGASRSAVGGGP